MMNPLLVHISGLSNAFVASHRDQRPGLKKACQQKITNNIPISFGCLISLPIQSIMIMIMIIIIHH